MTPDPMLDKATIVEGHLLRLADSMDPAGDVCLPVTLRRAALLIQQMRVRLESLQRDGVD